MRNYPPHRVAIAPMMRWTDRHCRYFHRLLTRRALLHTEMVVADAVIHGPRERLLGFHPAERPVALQLGGADPDKLAEAARIGADFGYDEIDLNVGCPSDRVKSGRFGACLMREPGLVAACVEAMREAVTAPVTVKCRLGVDDQDPETALDALAGSVFEAGADALWVHARKAWLKGLSPQENREIPPLDHDRVARLKTRFPHKFIGINGGIETLDHVACLLRRVDGVMLGRGAYRNAGLLADIDRRFYGHRDGPPDWSAVRDAMMAYAHDRLAAGERMAPVLRPLAGLFQGRPGARRYRRILSEGAARPGAGPQVVAQAFAAVRPAPMAQAGRAFGPALQTRS